MRYIVLAIAFLFFNCGIRAQQIDVDSIAFTDSLPVEIIYQKSIQENQITLGRNHFLSFPGSFDDPSRLLIKYPGFSTQNDQANFIIYDGMPPHYTKWNIYDTDIINPNHLSNAGTISDRSGRASGGVNMFSGQILGEFGYLAQPGMDGDQLSHAGIANMKPRTPYENKLFFNVSVIGLEAGIERRLNESGSSNLILNYRYSFTGLLGNMGVDFGGEVIGFQDAFAKVELDNTLGGKLSLFGVYGSSYNDHAAQDTIEVFKDGLNIRYDADIIIAGANHVSGNKRLTNSIVYSTRTDKRVSSKPNGFLPNIDLINSKSNIKESRLALHSKYTVSPSIKIGLRASSFIFDPDAQITPELSLKNRLSYVDFHPYASATIIHKERFNLDVKVGAYYETAFKEFSVMPALKLEYLMSSDLSLAFNYSLTSQMQAPELYQASGIGFSSNNSLKRSYGHHFRLGISKGDLSVSGFYHRLYDLVVPSLNVGFDELFTDLSNLDIIPNDPLFNEGSANIYGATASYDRDLSNDLYFSGNVSILRSDNYLGSGFPQSVPTPYDFGGSVNLRLQKKFELSKFKFLNLSTAFHYRGGGKENEIDLTESRSLGRTVYDVAIIEPYRVTLEPYHRLDLRISYVKKKSKNNSYKSVISMDIQNLYGRENDAYRYYDPVTDQVELQKQLGMLPVISYRLEF